jgi:hypothetical protein
VKIACSTKGEFRQGKIKILMICDQGEIHPSEFFLSLPEVIIKLILKKNK